MNHGPSRICSIVTVCGALGVVACRWKGRNVPALEGSVFVPQNHSCSAQPSSTLPRALQPQAVTSHNSIIHRRALGSQGCVREHVLNEPSWLLSKRAERDCQLPHFLFAPMDLLLYGAVRVVWCYVLHASICTATLAHCSSLMPCLRWQQLSPVWLDGRVCMTVHAQRVPAVSHPARAALPNSLIF